MSRRGIDGPSIAYAIGDPGHGEDAGVYVTQIYFYQASEVVAGALCNEEDGPMRDILTYATSRRSADHVGNVGVRERFL